MDENSREDWIFDRLVEIADLKDRLAEVEASETRLADLVWRIVNRRDTMRWDAIKPEWNQEAGNALIARPQTV